jgi:hypothetical protein
MLDELAASLVASWSTSALVLCPFTLTTATLEAQAALADTRSPPRMVQLSFADAEAPGMDDDGASLSAVARAFTAQDTVHDPTSVDAAVAVTDDIDTEALFNSLWLPLQESLLHTPLRPRAARRDPASLVPRRNDRLVAKAPFRDPNSEKQAKRVLVNKWERRSDNAVPTLRMTRSLTSSMRCSPSPYPLARSTSEREHLGDVLSRPVAHRTLSHLYRIISYLVSTTRGGATGWSLWAVDHPTLGPTEAHPCSLYWRIYHVRCLAGRLTRDRRFAYSPPCGVGMTIEID